MSMENTIKNILRESQILSKKEANIGAALMSKYYKSMPEEDFADFIKLTFTSRDIPKEVTQGAIVWLLMHLIYEEEPTTYGTTTALTASIDIT